MACNSLSLLANCCSCIEVPQQVLGLGYMAGVYSVCVWVHGGCVQCVCVGTCWVCTVCVCGYMAGVYSVCVWVYGGCVQCVCVCVYVHYALCTLVEDHSCVSDE